MYEQMECGEVCKRFHTDEKAGLTQQEAEKRLKADGKNRLKKVREETTIDRIQKQLNDPMIFVLFMAASVSILLREFSDTAIILFVIGLNTMIGVVQEGKAKKAMDALKKMTAPEATVKRNGTYRKIPAEELVKGDVVKVKAGDQVPADIRLFLCKGIEVNESALTGESTAVRKDCETIKQEVAASEQKNMLFLSTEIVKGNGEGIVVATGMETELGKIAKMINEQENEMTPLQKRLGDLGKILSKAAVFLCLLLFLMGVLQHRNLLQMLLLSISLAVAAIPEGLPAVVTIVLALGVARMAKANTIIRKLPAVETLGAVSVVCSDKTGTLTENKMKVLKLYAEDKTLLVSQVRPREFSRLMQGFLLCNNAVIGKTELGDSTELALLSMGEQMGISRERLEERYPRLEEIPFDSDKKYMVTLHKDQSQVCAYIKGACDYLLEVCSFWWIGGKIEPLGQIQKMKIRRVMEEMAEEGLRVLALAFKEHVSDWNESSIMKNLVFAGLAGMMDAPRKQVNQSVYQLKRAGVQVVMITGDYQETAFSIAKMTGIARKREQCVTGEELDAMSDAEFSSKMNDIRVFARVTPAHKVKIVKEFKKNGKIVAMTGDGVNDAPALKQADIGVAMGVTGSEVAKDAAAMVLTDDNFATIVKAVENGRNLYQHIKNAIQFLLSGNFGAILAVLYAATAGLPVPFAPVHLLFINLLTDSLPAIALGMEPHSKAVMDQKPRPVNESILTKAYLVNIGTEGLCIGIMTMAAFLIGYRGQDAVLASTMAFGTLCMSRLVHGFNCKDDKPVIFSKRFFNNKYLIGAFVLGTVLITGVLTIPGLHAMFKVVTLNMTQLMTVYGLAFLNLPVIQGLKYLKGKTKWN